MRRYTERLCVFLPGIWEMYFRLCKEDVWELICREVEYEDYTMEQIKADLETLVKWKNLTSMQNPRKVYTIADYKNKQYRYVVSEYVVEIGYLTIRLDNLFLESGQSFRKPVRSAGEKPSILFAN